MDLRPPPSSSLTANMTMKRRREAPVMVVVAVAVAVALSMSETCEGWYPFTRTLRIVNGMKTQLKIHCRSKDQDLGVRILRFRDRFQWEFRDQMWGTTQFSCDLWYTRRRKRRSGHFVVYDTANDNLRMHPCSDLCEWLVKANGLFAFDTEDAIWDFELPWPGWDDYDPGIAWGSVIHKRLPNLNTSNPLKF